MVIPLDISQDSECLQFIAITKVTIKQGGFLKTQISQKPSLRERAHALATTCSSPFLFLCLKDSRWPTQVHVHLILRGRLDWLIVFPGANYPPSNGAKKNACWLQTPVMKYYMCRIQRQLWNSPAMTCLWGFRRTCCRQSCHHARKHWGAPIHRGQGTLQAKIPGVLWPQRQQVSVSVLSTQWAGDHTQLVPLVQRQCVLLSVFTSCRAQYFL